MRNLIAILTPMCKLDGGMKLEFEGDFSNSFSLKFVSFRGTNQYLLDELIDEVAILNRVLTEDEINTIMTKGLDKALGITAVFPANKLATRWSTVKCQY
ncbi:hypothetical protein ACFL6S_07720 [Candidatus Poribacteria bacterium]